MDRQVGHLSHMLDDLLDISRFGQGKVRLQRGLLDLAGAVRGAVEDRRPGFESAGVNLVLELPNQPLWVDGDPTRLTQIVNNLLQNALKFTDRGGQVTVRVSQDAEGKQALLSVRDSGIGIEPEVLPHIFESFMQADRTLERSRSGLGLGLALVKGLVALHGGKVRAAQRRGGPGGRVYHRPPHGRAACAGHSGSCSQRAGSKIVAHFAGGGQPRFRRKFEAAPGIVGASGRGGSLGSGWRGGGTENVPRGGPVRPGNARHEWL